MARNRRQKIVEIMRNATCKLANRLHLLRLHKLGFKVFEFGRIGQHGDKGRFIRAAHGLRDTRMNRSS